MQDVITAFDAQTGSATCEIGTSGMSTILCVVTFQKPSFSQSSGVITLLGAPLTGTATATGTAANARIKDGAGTVQLSGLTVGTSGSDVNLSSTAINTGQQVTITSGTVTHSP
jgi:hypothetical protein